MNFFQSIAAVLTPAGLLWALLILTVATALHELAHYWAARAQGVAVPTFSVGMGPVLARTQWRGTEWRLSALPIGGYVMIEGMAGEPEPGSATTAAPPGRSFAALPALGKIAVLLAGPLMNLLLALLLLTGNFAVNGVSTPRPEVAAIAEVVAGSRAEALGLRAGDEIVSIDGRPTGNAGRVAEALRVAGPHTFTVHNGADVRTVRFDWQPTVNGKKALLGIRYNSGVTVNRVGLAGAFTEAGRTIVGAVPLVLNAFKTLFARFLTLNLQQDQGVAGPVGTAEIASRVAALGFWPLLMFAATINLSLGFFNLIPIPGLDGGRILLVLVGVLRGRPLSPQQEQAITFGGFAFVMLLSLFVVVRDLSRFF